MKNLLVVSLLFMLSSSASIVEVINSDLTSTWTATEYDESVISLEKVRRRLMAPVNEEPDYSIAKVDLVGAVPSSFSAQDQWGSLILPVRDQADCGSCWAFGVAETFGDRLGIVNGKSQGVFSPQDLVSCDTNKNQGCNGGYLDVAWNYAVKTGLALDACLPYTSGNGKTAKCPSQCSNGSSIVRTKAKSAAAVSVSNFQNELYTNGPFEVAFNVYTDFVNYKSGVYTHKSGKLEGGHAVLLTGWGTENGVNYWLIRNSWGPNWGINGYFKIRRGGNECGIESNGYAGKF